MNDCCQKRRIGENLRFSRKSGAKRVFGYSTKSFCVWLLVRYYRLPKLICFNSRLIRIIVPYTIYLFYNGLYLPVDNVVLNIVFLPQAAIEEKSNSLVYPGIQTATVLFYDLVAIVPRLTVD